MTLEEISDGHRLHVTWYNQKTIMPPKPLPVTRAVTFEPLLQHYEVPTPVEAVPTGEPLAPSRVDGAMPHAAGAVAVGDADGRPGQLSHLAEQVVACMREAFDRRFSNARITEIVKSLGDWCLSVDEQDELFGRIASMPGIVAREDGSLVAKGVPSADQGIGGNPPPLRLRGNPDGSGLTPRQIRRAIGRIDDSPEVQQARDLAKRIANPRRHGHK